MPGSLILSVDVRIQISSVTTIFTDRKSERSLTAPGRVRESCDVGPRWDLNMAVHPTVRSEHAASSNLTVQQAQAISAWTEQATASLQNLEISESRVDATAADEAAPTVRGTSIALTIPLDEPSPTTNTRVKIVPEAHDDGPPKASSTAYRRREPIRRDSLKRREALLKGKEGSRRRQRWENGRCHRCLVSRMCSLQWNERSLRAMQ